MTATRTVRDFVEELLSNGKDADYIIMIASNTYWQTRINEVIEEIKSFSIKLKKRFTEAQRFLR